MEDTVNRKEYIVHFGLLGVVREAQENHNSKLNTPHLLGRVC